MIATLLFAFGVGTNAQEPSKAILIDEFGKLPCGDMMARLDNLFMEVSNRPVDSHGYAVILGDASSLPFSLRVESMIRGYGFGFRNFPKDKLSVLRRVSPIAKIQFWVGEAGSQANFPGESWTLTVPKSNRPFMFWEQDESECNGGIWLDFEEMLRRNPTARANLVLRGSPSDRRRLRRSVAESFRAISKIRFRFFELPKSYGRGDIELWFIP